MNGVTPLLSCPFCGNNSSLESIEMSELVEDHLCDDISLFHNRFTIICSAVSTGCGGSGPQASSRISAAHKWNYFRAATETTIKISDYE